MKKYLLINVLRYICILFVFALGFISIVGSNGGGGSDDFDLGFQWDTDPHTPANIVATAVTSIKINLSWTASKNAAEYAIYRNGTYLKTVGKSQGPPTSDKGCNPASRYCYTVRACKDFFFSQIPSFKLVHSLFSFN